MTSRLTVYLAAACLAAALSLAPAQPGPRLTDAQLFSALNLNYPGLELVRTNVQAADYPAARSNLTQYIRNRTNVFWLYDWKKPAAALSFSRTTADLATNGYVNQIGIPFTFPDGDIDWWYNYTTNPACGCTRNNEWQWTLNRMAQWQNLGRTYWGTTNEDYAVWWGRQLRDWIADCPTPTSRQNGAGSPWRTIESGIRMSTPWPDTFFRFVLSPSLTNEEHVLYLKSNIEHGRYLNSFFTSAAIAPANFLTMEMNGLFTIGTLFPELNEAGGWRSFAANTLYTEQTNQFLPDGVHDELTPRYHGVAIDNIANIYELAATNSRLGEIPPGYLANLERSFDFYVRVSTPERTTPAFNDSSRENVRSWTSTALNFFPNRTDYQWFASRGATGAPPDFVSYNYPWAGYAVMRSSWESNANYACFDVGALGSSGHRHEDKLNLVLWANGREFLLDNGGGPYDTSIWRTWGMTSFSHNTVVVDGLQQKGGDGTATPDDPDYNAQAPIDMRWESDIYHDFAAGVFNRGYGTYADRRASHHRRVLFVKPDIFVVADTLIPTNTAAHTYESRWHLRSTNTAFFPDTGTVVTTDPGLPNLAVVPCYPAGLTVGNVSSRLSLDGTTTNLAEMIGWDLVSTSVREAPATTVTHTLSGVGTQQFLTVFLPMPAGATNPVISVASIDSTNVEILLNDGRTLRVFADPNPARGLRLAEFLPGGALQRNVGAGFVPPRLTGLTNRVMNPNSSRLVSFGVQDADGSAASVIVTAVSLDPGIIPATGLALSGSGSNRMLTITPAANASGVARIVLLATDSDGSTLGSEFAVTVNAPPFAGATASTWEEQPMQALLFDLISDDLTPAPNLEFTVLSSLGGEASILPDGATLAFSPDSNFAGRASVQVRATDMGFDSRWLLYYSFENDSLTDRLVEDGSGSLRPGSIGFSGTGKALLDPDVPAALGVANRASVLLTETTGANAAQLNRLIPTSEFNFSDSDWSFSGWFNRAAAFSEDFIFYLGNGDGFGSNEELHLHLAGAATLSLRHYTNTSPDVNLSVPGVATGTWNHAALTFTRTNSNAGMIRLYLNGSLMGETNVARFNLDQSLPVVFGGQNRTNSTSSRWFGGRLDELALYAAALTPAEVLALASRTPGHLVGLSVTNTVTIVVRDINDPPWIGTAETNTPVNAVLNVDLHTWSGDAETPPGHLIYGVIPGTNGSVSLLADGRTARFTPLANHEGFASFTYTVTDTGVDPRTFLHYGFEAPDDTADATATDETGNTLDGAMETSGSGQFTYVTNAPAALAWAFPVSLSLSESGTNNSARLARAISPGEFNFSNQSWTFAGWFKRNAQTNDDFIFYLGAGDGFGANEELQLYGVSGSSQVGLRHFVGEATTDVNLFSPAISGAWNHVAVTFERTNTTIGIMRLFVNGNGVGAAVPLLNLDQSRPVGFGGHNATSMLQRWFGGMLDDLVLFHAALSSNEVQRLASGSVKHFGGLTITNTVSVRVGDPNLAPVFADISNRTVMAGSTVQIVPQATDPNSPPQRLRYSLLNAPAGASISNGVFVWRSSIQQGGSNYVVSLVATEDGLTTTLAPAADATLRDGSFAALNFGTDTNLSVKRSTLAGSQREALLLFNLGSLPGSIAAAELSLLPITASLPGVQAVARTLSNNWTEAGVTWNTRPASDTAFATWSVQPGVTSTIPVTALASAAQATDKLLSLRLFSTNTTGDGLVNYGSRENLIPAYRPALSLTVTNATPLSATQAFQIAVLTPPRPSITQVIWSNGAPWLQITGALGPDYLLQAATNLATPAWITLSTNTPVASPLWLADPAGTHQQRFYRLLLGP